MPIQTSRTFAVQTDFLSASDAARLVARVGVVSVLRMVTTAIEEDYLRWQDFDKSARTAAHSENGVIELMPVADARDYAFKYVNGHPINTRYGLPTVMAFGALADVATGMPRFVSELTLTTAAHRRHVGNGGQAPGPPGQPQHGTDWQRLTKRVSGAGLYGAAGRA